MATFFLVTIRLNCPKNQTSLINFTFTDTMEQKTKQKVMRCPLTQMTQQRLQTSLLTLMTGQENSIQPTMKFWAPTMILMPLFTIAVNPWLREEAQSSFLSWQEKSSHHKVSYPLFMTLLNPWVLKLSLWKSLNRRDVLTSLLIVVNQGFSFPTLTVCRKSCRKFLLTLIQYKYVNYLQHFTN